MESFKCLARGLLYLSICLMRWPVDGDAERIADVLSPVGDLAQPAPLALSSCHCRHELSHFDLNFLKSLVVSVGLCICLFTDQIVESATVLLDCLSVQADRKACTGPR